MQIDPIEAVINLLLEKSIASNVGNRIADKHHYLTNWDKTQNAIIIRADGGDVNQNIETTYQDVDIRCYDTSSTEAMRLARKFIDVIREIEREIITTSNGDALIYSVSQVSGISRLFDPELDMDYALIIATVHVSEESL